MTPFAAAESPPAGTSATTTPEPVAAGPSRPFCDWRFVLPIDERSRVLDLTGDAAVADVVSADAGVLQVADPETAEFPPGGFNVILVHDAWDTTAMREPTATARLRALRARLAAGGALWIAGSRHGPGAGAWERRLHRAGFAVVRRFALVPDARQPRRIRPFEHEVARALAARLPGTPPAPVVDALRRAVQPLRWADRLVVSFGIVARATRDPR